MTGCLVPVLPSVAAAVAGSLFPRAVPALADRRDPRTRVSSPPEAGMKKPFRRRARKGSVVIHRCCEALSSVLTLRACGRIQRAPEGSLGTAVANRVRETRRVAGQFDWLHPFHHHHHRSLAEAEGLEPPWTRFWRPPLSPLSYTSSAEPNKKAASVDPGRLAYLGLVVSRFKTSTSAPRRP